MRRYETKTNPQCVHAGPGVSRQDGDRGNSQRTGGRSLQRCPEFTSLEVAGFYYHRGANIQPGVFAWGRRLAMTEVKRKPGAGEEQRSGGELERLLSGTRGG